MSFLYPKVLMLLLVPVILGVAALVRRRFAGKGWGILVSADHPELIIRSSAWRSLLPPFLVLPALVCVILALGRPINGYESGRA